MQDADPPRPEGAKKTETLIAKIKAWNIAAVPLFVIAVGLLIALVRRFSTAAR